MLGGESPPRHEVPLAFGERVTLILIFFFFWFRNPRRFVPRVD
jgi:hypothetical protein